DVADAAAQHLADHARGLLQYVLGDPRQGRECDEKVRDVRGFALFRDPLEEESAAFVEREGVVLIVEVHHDIARRGVRSVPGGSVQNGELGFGGHGDPPWMRGEMSTTCPLSAADRTSFSEKCMA